MPEKPEKISKNQSLGEAGESKAADYLILNNYLILEKNWRFQHKEVDIIAKKDNLLVFCEVKTRSTNFFQEPKEAVTIKKRKNLFVAAQAYIDQHKMEEEIRFDIISIIYEKGIFNIEHIQDAFHPLTT